MSWHTEIEDTLDALTQRVKDLEARVWDIEGDLHPDHPKNADEQPTQMGLF